MARGEVMCDENPEIFSLEKRSNVSQIWPGLQSLTLGFIHNACTTETNKVNLSIKT